MWPVVPLSAVVAVTVATFALALFAVRAVQPRWWRSPAVRVGMFVAFGGIALGIALWAVGGVLHDHSVVYRGSTLAQGGLIVLLPAVLMMPVAALVDRVLGQPKRAAVASSTETTSRAVSRRALFRYGGASLPAMAALGTASGLVQAKADPKLPVVRMRYPGLHPDLDGLRIMQLSDIHLGACLGLEDLAHALDRACARHRPDLVVFTGDLAENVELIEPALARIAATGTRYGAFASLGNHEYFHDISLTRPRFEASPVKLLVNAGQTLAIGRATLFIGGVADPVVMDGDIAGLVAPWIESTAAQGPAAADFRLLLCHRPEGHGPAASHGFDLTLSGHTHGGQIGLFGRSIFERLAPGIGWWGSYSRPRQPGRQQADAKLAGGPSRLYTTSGAGHWLPFRIGCPTEIPLIVLEAERV